MPNPPPDASEPADATTITFVGWYDSSLDLMRGLTVTEWGLLDEAPTERRAWLMPEAAANHAFTPERRRRLRG